MKAENSELHGSKHFMNCLLLISSWALNKFTSRYVKDKNNSLYWQTWSWETRGTETRETGRRLEEINGVCRRETNRSYRQISSICSRTESRTWIWQAFIRRQFWCKEGWPQFWRKEGWLQFSWKEGWLQSHSEVSRHSYSRPPAFH